MGLLHVAGVPGLDPDGWATGEEKKGSLPCPSHHQADPRDGLWLGQHCSATRWGAGPGHGPSLDLSWTATGSSYPQASRGGTGRSVQQRRDFLKLGCRCRLRGSLVQSDEQIQEQPTQLFTSRVHRQGPRCICHWHSVAPLTFRLAERDRTAAPPPPPPALVLPFWSTCRVSMVTGCHSPALLCPGAY